MVGDASQIVAESIAVEDIPSEHSVVDVGGAMCILPRADYVVDKIPFTQMEKYAPRNLQYPVRVKESHWITAGVCEPMTYFKDRQFDYSFCSQVVEDVRDPIALVREISRISKVGFISTVNWMYELSSFEGAWAGYWHHRWLVGVRDGDLEFIAKPPFLYPPAPGYGCTAPLFHVWWSFDIRATEIFYEGRPDVLSFTDFLLHRWG